ncbi:hypothetical protein VNI00_016963 [Paramarasmius palmivorus]|uniref:DUF6593 domain-containing protein n=1 Tax=Paramarasmius palmivorus TaxID=297713 RepID=A0AAW0BC38_9AGAR
MDLIFSKYDMRNSLLTRADEPVYEISTTRGTPLTMETTVIKKFRKDGEKEHMGLIELCRTEDKCEVWGKNMPPKSDGFFKKYEDVLRQSPGRSFVASDGQKYTWKLASDGNQELCDQSKNIIATSEKAHSGFFSGKPSPARLSIATAGVPMIDDIVTTFMAQMVR